MMPVARVRLLLALTCGAAWFGPVEGQQPRTVLQGTVADSSATPLADVELTLLPLGLRTRTDTAGQFVFEVAAGQAYRLIARRIGFVPDTFAVTLQPGVVNRRWFTLSRIQWMLRAEIVALQYVLPRLLERADRGISQVMLQDEIKAYRVYEVTDLLRFVPIFNRIGRGQIVFIDGRPSRGRHDHPNPSDIVAIEITDGLMGWNEPDLWPPFWLNRSDRVSIVMIWTRAYTSEMAARRAEGKLP